MFSLSKESSHHDYFSTHKKISVRSSLFVAVTPTFARTIHFRSLPWELMRCENGFCRSIRVRPAGSLRVIHPHLTILKIESEEEPTYLSAHPADEPDIIQALSSVAHSGLHCSPSSAPFVSIARSLLGHSSFGLPASPSTGSKRPHVSVCQSALFTAVGTDWPNDIQGNQLQPITADNSQPLGRSTRGHRSSRRSLTQRNAREEVRIASWRNVMGRSGWAEEPTSL